MKHIKCIVALLLSATLLLSGAFTASAYEAEGVDVYAQAALVADMTHDTVVYEKNADAKMYPASLTKIMTAMVVLDECADPASVVVTATFEALDPLYGTDSSICGLEIGEEMSALDLVSVMMIQSANDAANVLAYHFGNDSIDAFVDKMNQKAQELGLKNTHFTNAHGLHDSEHYTTARDMYTLSKYAMANPMFKEMVSSLYYEIPETNVHWEQVVETTVFLQNPDEPDYYYEYASGIKTGYTDPAGLCLTSTATKDGTTYFCVVMKCPVETEGSHFTLSKSLYEWAFNTLEYRAVRNTDAIIGEQAVELGKGCETVSAMLQTSIEGVVPKTLSSDDVQVQVAWDAASVTAPIEKGQKLGTATVSVNGAVLGTSDLIAANAVEKSTWKAIGKALKEFFSNPIVCVLSVIIGILVLLVGLFFLYVAWARYERRKRRRRRAEARRRRMEEQNRNPFDVENRQ